MQNGGDKVAACKAAGYANTNFINKLIEDDPEFAAEYKEAMTAANDVIRSEIVNRAVQGTIKDVYHQGQVVGHERINHNDLLKFVAAARMPEEFGEKTQITGTINHNHKVGIAMIPMAAPDPDQWERLLLANKRAKAVTLESTPVPDAVETKK